MTADNADNPAAAIPYARVAATDPDDATAVLDYVRDTNVPCPACDYNLRNLTEPRCPECGERLRLRVVLTDVRIGLWLAAVIPLFLSAGAGVLFTILVCKRGMPRNSPGTTAVCTFIAAIPLAVLAAFTRNLFQRLPAVVKVTLAVVFITVILVQFIWSSMVIK